MKDKLEDIICPYYKNCNVDRNVFEKKCSANYKVCSYYLQQCNAEFDLAIKKAYVKFNNSGKK